MNLGPVSDVIQVIAYLLQDTGYPLISHLPFIRCLLDRPKDPVHP
jgi:hypothetical protein